MDPHLPAPLKNAEDNFEKSPVLTPPVPSLQDRVTALVSVVKELNARGVDASRLADMLEKPVDPVWVEAAERALREQRRVQLPPALLNCRVVGTMDDWRKALKQFARFCDETGEKFHSVHYSAWAATREEAPPLELLKLRVSPRWADICRKLLPPEQTLSLQHPSPLQIRCLRGVWAFKQWIRKTGLIHIDTSGYYDLFSRRDPSYPALRTVYKHLPGTWTEICQVAREFAKSRPLQAHETDIEPETDPRADPEQTLKRPLKGDGL